jgi:hypothetical protein
MTDPNGVCELMDCSANVFVHKFSMLFSKFSAVLLMFGHPKRSSSSTDTRPDLKSECHSITDVLLKEASRNISRVSVPDLLSFTQNLMQTRCSILPFIANKTKHEVEKALVQKHYLFTARCHAAD